MNIGHLFNRNPIDDAHTLYRMSKDRTNAQAIKLKRKQNYQIPKHKVILLKRLCLHLVFSKKFYKIPGHLVCTYMTTSFVEADHPPCRAVALKRRRIFSTNLFILSSYISLNISLFNCLTLVVNFFTTSNRDRDFDIRTFTIQR